jgi:hypothetical protein
MKIYQEETDEKKEQSSEIQNIIQNEIDLIRQDYDSEQMNEDLFPYH